MGSRRSYSLVDVVGKSRELSSEKSALTRAIDAGDSDGIVSASGRLVEKSDRASDFFYYGIKLRQALRDTAKSAPSDPIALDKYVRALWARVKREQVIPEDKALDRVVLDSAKAALKGRGD